MPIETSDVLPFLEWLPGAAAYWAITVGCLLAAGVGVGWLVSAVRRGPTEALFTTSRCLFDAVVDMATISPRRVMALTMLAVRESIRRRVVVVFAVFLAVMLLAGWFITPTTNQPARVYLEVVLTTTRYLMLCLALVLSALSLPADIKNHTLYTVVTKPVRSGEIVLGRICGFVVIGTGLLAGMGAISYVFTVRSLSHTHEVAVADLQEEPRFGTESPAKKGVTSSAKSHEHEVTVDSAGDIHVESKHGHTHGVTVEGAGKDAVYLLGPPQGQLVARVPLYGKLRFKDRTGKDVERGVNVGDEWTYRSFIEGGGRATAIWSFSGITERMFPKGEFPDAIPLEMTIEAFRTHKGDLKRGILGSLSLRNPETDVSVNLENFLAKKFATDVHWIPREVEHRRADGTTETLDLFRDLVSEDGRLEVWIQCLEGGQYFGMAQADMYFRAGDASFVLNFIKGYLGIWIQMVLILGFGVMFSTFLGGPVAFLATLGAFVGGLSLAFMTDIANRKVLGGGPFEAMIRILNQQNLVTGMEPGLPTNVATMSDRVVESMMWVVSSILPELGSFEFTGYVSYGFDVGPDLLLKSLVRTVAFLVPLVLAGYFFLKAREIAR